MTREEVAGFMKYLQEEERRKVDGIVPSTNEIAFGIAIEALKQPQIVRCKDCTFLHDEGNGEYGCTIHDDLYVSADDWFCADGERKEGDGDGT